MHKKFGIHFYINIDNLEQILIIDENKNDELKHSFHQLDTFIASIEKFSETFLEDCVVEKFTTSRLHIYYRVECDDDGKPKEVSITNRSEIKWINLLKAFIGQMIVGMSCGQIAADRSQFMRMFLTKDRKWEYQKEWRLLGDANDKLSAPSIHAIYLGKNMDNHNKKQMIDYCRTHEIVVHIKNW